MASRILHLLDPSTPADAIDMLALLIARLHHPSFTHHVTCIGHNSTRTLAQAASVPVDGPTLPSMGWADPLGWRSVRRLIHQRKPTHLHAWGATGIVAASSFTGPRLATLADVPSRGVRRLLRIVDHRPSSDINRWTWMGASPSIVRSLLSAGLTSSHVHRVSPGVRMPGSPAPAAIKDELGIAPDDGPIILLGGEGPHARHDHGLWAVAILQQIFPRTRVIVRDDPRGTDDTGLARFLGTLPQNDMVVVAPATKSWPELMPAADILLATPDASIPVGSILAAMAARVPIIGTPIECVSDLIEHGHNGLLAKSVKPRAIAARLEEFMNDATLRWPLTDRARADIYEHFSPSVMVDAFARLYAGERTPLPVEVAS